MPKMRLMADTPKVPCLMQVCSNPQAGTPKVPCHQAGTCLLVGIPKMLCLTQVLAGQQMTQVFRGEALMQVS